MKNIHILPTDKPSRLHKIGNELGLTDKPNSNFLAKQQNLYITSDEEIKEGDWWLNRDDNKIYHNIFWQLANNAPSCKKIIITTDNDLIKYSVQPIDDEFLEWFVKNPSCEEVDINREGYKKNGMIDEATSYQYKIIIPKEELKQETLEDITLEEVFGSEYCQFSVVENKLAILYRNQEQLLKAIKLLSNEK